MHTHRRTCALALLVFTAVLFTVPAWAQAERFTLGKLVPEDVHFFANWHDTPARARLMEGYTRAFTKLAESGIVEDIVELATFESSERERKQIRQILKNVFQHRQSLSISYNHLCA